MHTLFKNAITTIALASMLAGCIKGRTADMKPPAKGNLSKLVEAALPELIGSDNSKLVFQLQGARLGKPLSETFDSGRVVGELFKGAEPIYAPDCNELQSVRDNSDRDMCSVSFGQASGQGAFMELRFSKHMGLGTVTFQSREADRNIEVSDLKPVKLSEEEAYKLATQQLITVFGLPVEEIPKAPTNAKNLFPARNLMIGRGNSSGVKGVVAVKKVVSIQRGLYVGIDSLPWVPAPGRATVVIDDNRASQVLIRDWQDLRPHPQLNPKNAKSRSELVEEIVADLSTASDAPVASMKSRIIFTALPEETYGLIMPTLQVSVSPLLADLSEEQQEKVSGTTAGYVREYSLVRLDEGKGEQLLAHISFCLGAKLSS